MAVAVVAVAVVVVAVVAVAVVVVAVVNGWIGAQLLVQIVQLRVADRRRLPVQPAEQVGAPLAQVNDPRCHPGRV